MNSAEKEKKRLFEKHAKILRELAKEPANSVCADCGTQSPRWASWNLGVFLCIRCGGFHRRLGTHVTKVKSTTLDNWTPEQIEHFRHIGNEKANAYFTPTSRQGAQNLNTMARSDMQLAKFIRDKYENRIYVERGSVDPTVIAGSNSNNYSPSTGGGGGGGSRGNYSEASKIRDGEVYGMTKLREMGFKDVRKNHDALVKCEYNVEAAIRYLTRGPGAATETEISANDERVKKLKAMGFEDTQANIQALKQSKGDLQASIELLLTSMGSANSGTSKSQAKDETTKNSGSGTKENKTDLLFSFDELSISNPNKKEESSGAADDGFGDFLSAEPTTPATPAATSMTNSTAAGSAGGSRGGGNIMEEKSIFDDQFIMSLYSKSGSNTSSNINGINNIGGINSMSSTKKSNVDDIFGSINMGFGNSGSGGGVGNKVGGVGSNGGSSGSGGRGYYGVMDNPWDQQAKSEKKDNNDGKGWYL